MLGLRQVWEVQSHQSGGWWRLVYASYAASLGTALLFPSGSVFMLRGRLGNGAGQLLCFWRGVLVNSASYRHAPRRRNNVPTVCLRCSSDCCVHALCPCVVCLPSLQAQPTALWALFHPNPLTFKLQALSPSGCKNSPNLAPLFFQASGFRETFLLWVPLCAPLPHHIILLCDCISFPSTSPMICFSLKPYIHTFYLLWCGLLSLFSFGVCSVRI